MLTQSRVVRGAGVAVVPITICRNDLPATEMELTLCLQVEWVNQDLPK